MAARDYTPPDRRHLLLLVAEERILSQTHEIQTLLHDNQRLAAIHVALKRDLVAADHDIRRLSAAAPSVKADRDAQVREVYERSRRLEAEARSVNGLVGELERVRAEVEEIRAEREKMLEKLKGVEAEVEDTRVELEELPRIKAEVEKMRREVQRGRAAIEYERKMHEHNMELSEAMDKHIISMAREAEKLRVELENAEKRAMAAAAAAVVAANPGN